MFAIVLVGLARSGKDTAADYLQGKYGFKKLVFSDLLIDEIKAQGLEVDKKNMAIVGDGLREREGMGVLGKRILEKAKAEQAERAVLVGARSVEEVDYVKEDVEKCFVIKVVADKEKRFDRKLEDDPQNKEEFFARDERDIKNKGLKDVLDLAEFSIENNSTINDLKMAIDELMSKIYK